MRKEKKVERDSSQFIRKVGEFGGKDDDKGNYGRYPHELTMELLKLNMPARELKIILVVMMYTYGYSKQIDQIPRSTFARITGINERHISDLVDSAVKRNIIIKIPGKGGRYGGDSFEIETNISRWIKTKKFNGTVDGATKRKNFNGTSYGPIKNSTQSTKKGNGTKKGTSMVPSTGFNGTIYRNSMVPPTVHTNKINKEIIKKIPRTNIRKSLFLLNKDLVESKKFNSISDTQHKKTNHHYDAKSNNANHNIEKKNQYLNLREFLSFLKTKKGSLGSYKHKQIETFAQSWDNLFFNKTGVRNKFSQEMKGGKHYQFFKNKDIESIKILLEKYYLKDLDDLIMTFFRYLKYGDDSIDKNIDWDFDFRIDNFFKFCNEEDNGFLSTFKKRRKTNWRNH